MSRMALEGLRIIDAGTVQAGPWATRLLADMGAQVIRVESRVYPEGSRLLTYPDNKPGVKFWEQGAIYHEQHRNKGCITLELNFPQGAEVFKRLAKVSDVVMDSRPPRVMKNFGLDYESLKEVNPAIIFISSCGYGHGGPYSYFRSYGMPAEAMAGLTMYTGYEGGPPRRGSIPYPDHISAMHGAVAILTALEYRRRTGKGQWIDLAHYEVAIGVTGQGVMDYVMNQRTTPRMGDGHMAAAPHGVYPCKGLDKWVAIEVKEDEEWEGLCRAMGDPVWAKEERFSTALGRREHRDELDRLVGEWTKEWDYYEVMHALQKEGVSSGAVLSNKGLLLDPHLKARGFWEMVKHKDEQEGVGTRPFPGAMWKMSKTPGGIRMPAPTLGQDNEAVLHDLLGYSWEEIEELKEITVIGTEPESKDLPPARRADPATLKELGQILEYDPNYKEILGIE